MMKKLLALFMLTLLCVSGWAQVTPEAAKVYTIKAHFTSSGHDDLYLTNTGEQNLQFKTELNGNKSYWVAKETGVTKRPWKFQSGYGDGRYLDGNVDGALSTTGLNVSVGTVNSSFNYLEADITVGTRYLGTWNANHTPGFGNWGGCFGRSHSTADWTTNYLIEEVQDVEVYNVSINSEIQTLRVNLEDYIGCTSVKDGGLVIVPSGTELSANDFAFSTGGNIAIDKESKTISLSFPTINYTITDAAGTSYTGSYTGGQGEMPSFTGVTGLTYQNVVWSTDGDDLTLTANITFPFPVSSSTVNNYTYIAGLPNSVYCYWYASGEKVKARKLTLPTNQEGENAKWKWAIIPTLNGNAFSFKIKNESNSKFITAAFTANEHNDGTVTLTDEGTALTYSGKFGGPNSRYLSVNTSYDDNEQNLGTWTNHGGVNVGFAAPADFEALMTKLNRYVIGEGVNKYTTTEANATKIAAVKDGTQFATAAEFANMMNACTINQPATEKYYRIKGVNPSDPGWYLTDNNGTLCSYTKDANDEKTVWYLTADNKLQSKATGNYIKGVDMVENTEEADAISFSASQYQGTDGRYVFGSYAIKPASYSNGNGLISWTNYHSYKMYQTSANDTRCQWQLEEVIDELQALINEAQSLIDEPLVIGKPSQIAKAALAVAIAEESNPTIESVTAAIEEYNTTTNLHLPTGYYYMKNLDGNRYVYNDYNHDGNDNHYTLVSNTKVTTNNGIWYVKNNDDGTINIKNGEGQPMKGDEKFGANNTFATLHFGNSQVDGGIYFTEGIHFATGAYYKLSDGTYYITKWEHSESAGSNYTFEPVENIASKIVVPIIVNGDDTGNACVVFDGAQTAFNGGFYVVTDKGRFQEGSESLGKITFAPVENGSIDGRPDAEGVYTLHLYYSTEQERAALAAEIAEAYPKIVKWIESDKEYLLSPGEIGYPVNNIYSQEYEELDDEYKVVYNEIMGEFISTCALVHFGIAISQYAQFMDLFEQIKALPIVNLPTPSAFYSLNGNIYYLNENSELLSYSNGLYAKVEGDEEAFTLTSYPAGTADGEEVAFASARDSYFKPIFGQLYINHGISYYPSGDGNYMSGWTIKPVTELAVKSNAVADVYYSTLNMPVNVVIPEDVTAYAATINEDGKSLHLEEVELDDNRVLNANNPVILTSSASIPNVTVTSEAGVDAGTNDLKGTTYADVQDGSSTCYVLNQKDGVAGFYRLNAGKPLPVFRAYYIPTVASSNGFVFSYTQDDLTAIEEAIISTVNKDVYRDLNGRPVVNPIKGQIYIQNGKAIKY